MNDRTYYAVVLIAFFAALVGGILIFLGIAEQEPNTMPTVAVTPVTFPASYTPTSSAPTFEPRRDHIHAENSPTPHVRSDTWRMLTASGNGPEVEHTAGPGMMNK